MAPSDAASPRVDLCEVEGRVCGCGFRPHNLEYVLGDSFEVGNPCTRVAVHGIVVSLIAVLCEAVNVKGLCLDSVGGNDGFCPVR